MRWIGFKGSVVPDTDAGLAAQRLNNLASPCPHIKHSETWCQLVGNFDQLVHDQRVFQRSFHKNLEGFCITGFIQ